MPHFLLVFFVSLFFVACGVDTSSSVSDPKANKPVSQTTPGGVTQPVDGQQTSDTNVSTDVNNTNVDHAKNSLFDTNGAEYDPYACNGNLYRVASDASYSGTKSGENGATLFPVNGQGLWIGSEHLEAEPENKDKTWVMLFYKAFPDPASLGVQGSTSYTMNGVFQISYDIAWSDTSISGVDNKVYVQSANGKKPSCYRMYLNQVDGSKLEVTKVYR